MRRRLGAFTCDRYLTLSRIVAMMSRMCASVQAELDTLFGQLKDMAVRCREVSAHAFSKARKRELYTT